MPPPATWPSSSSVERLCGQPEQKFGMRGCHRCDGACRFPRISSSRADARHVRGRAQQPGQHARDRLRIELAGGRKQRLARPRRACRSRSAAAAGCRALRATATRGNCASLRPPGWFPGPRANSATKRGSSGNVMPNLAMRMPSASRSSRRMPQIAQRLHQVVIGFARAWRCPAARRRARRSCDSRGSTRANSRAASRRR